jgi:flagellar basal body-associated protein FliL
VIIVIAVVLAAVGAGLAVGLGATRKAGPPGDEAQNATEPDAQLPAYSYVPFGPVIVNLNEGRLTRYLKIALALKVVQNKSDALTEIIEGNQQALFNDWLIVNLSDLGLEDVKGAPAIRAQRRVILAGFNGLLAEISDVQLDDILLTEFNVQ